MITDTQPAHPSRRASDDIEPHFAPQRDVKMFQSEVDALNHAFDTARKLRPGLTRTQFAMEIRTSGANVTKMLQGMSGIPVDLSATIARVTQSYALQQFRNEQHGLVSKTKKQEERDQRELQELREINAKLHSQLIESDDVCIELKRELEARQCL